MAVVNTKDILGTKKKTTFLQAVSRTALIPSVALGNVATRMIEKNIQKTIDPTYKAGRTTTLEASKTTTGQILGGLTAAAGVGLGVATGGAAAIWKTTAGKIATPLILGGAVVSPTITKTIIQTPAFLFDKGMQIGEKVESLPETIKEKDLGILPLIGVGLGLGLGVPLVYDLLTDKKEKAILDEQLPVVNIPVVNTPEVMKEAGVVTPQTQLLATSGDIPRKKRRSKPLPQQIKQSVRISIDNNNSLYRTTKKYINMLAY